MATKTNKISSKIESDISFNTFTSESKNEPSISERNIIKSQEKINLLTSQANKDIKSLYNLSVVEIGIGIKNTWFGILDDFLNKKKPLEIIMKDNRLFYVGLTIIILAIILFIINYFRNSESNNNYCCCRNKCN
jgi:hypothetical protein